MQFVNDDMDDLFRRAAEEYPLKTDSADWDKLASKMQAEDEHKNASGKKRNKAKYLLLLALIPLFLICTTYIKNDLPGKITELKDKETQEKQSTPGLNAKTTTKIKTRSEIEAGREIPATASESTGQGETSLIKRNTDPVTEINSKEHVGANTINYGNKKLPTQTVKLEPAHDSETLTNPIDGLDKNKESGKNFADKTGGDNNKVATNPTSPGEKDSKPIASDEKNATKKEEPSVTEDSKTTPLTTTSKDKKVKKKEAKFYFGLQAGPDFSMVKSTNVRGVGFGFGLLGGYNISKKLAVETGLFWDRKSYQSEGRYFKTESLNWPHVTVLDLSGYCNMYEIPLNIRYNVSANSERTWFANAGLSSYLMKKEKYDYDYERYGVYQKGSREYKNTTNNWLSVAHLSIGLQKKLGTVGDLRIEPYVKLPLNGLGLGSLPLRSTGIYLGITRPIR